MRDFDLLVYFADSGLMGIAFYAATLIRERARASNASPSLLAGLLILYFSYIADANKFHAERDYDRNWRRSLHAIIALAAQITRLGFSQMMPISA